LEVHTRVEEKKQLYAPYNILPLDPESGKEAIMRYPEVCSLLLCFDPIFIYVTTSVPLQEKVTTSVS